jgi:hypothetical protein
VVCRLGKIQHQRQQMTRANHAVYDPIFQGTLFVHLECTFIALDLDRGAFEKLQPTVSSAFLLLACATPLFGLLHDLVRRWAANDCISYTCVLHRCIQPCSMKGRQVASGINFLFARKYIQKLTPLFFQLH